MEEDVTKGLLKPTGKFASVEELFKNRNIAATPVRRGLKKTVSDGSFEEQQEILRLQNELRLLLSRPRVERQSARSQGEWDSDLKAVKLIRKTGKFQSFGYTANKVDYLENYEALFLLELNRLELYFNTVIVSVEQAYHLLLGDEKSRNYDKYLVYSTLSQAGYIVRKVSNRSFTPPIPANHPCNDIDCIWEILRFKLNPNYKIPTHIKNYEKFSALSASMTSLADRIRNYSTPEQSLEEDDATISNFQPEKRRRATSEPSSARKRQKLDYKIGEQPNSFLDALKDEREYQKFHEIFEKIDVITLKAFDDFDEENSRKLELDFDLYLSKGGFKKNGSIPPNFRVIVLGSEDQFPSRSELVMAFRSHRVAVPLLVVSLVPSKPESSQVNHQRYMRRAMKTTLGSVGSGWKGFSHTNDTSSKFSEVDD